MESEGEVISSSRESDAVPRLRPLRTNRIQEGTIPSTSYLEESWKDEPMTPAGRVFIDPVFDCVCVCILGFKEPLDTETFKNHVEMTIMKHKRFSSKVETRKGRPWWTQVKADVNDHVLDVQLTPEQIADKDIVLNYTTDVILHKPFDKSKPLWDIHLLDAHLGEAVSCAIVRIHHALGDGTSLISLLMACTRKSGKPDVLPTLPAASKGSPKNSPSFFARLFLAICNIFLIFWHSLTEIGKFMASLIWLKDSETPIKGAAGCEHSPKKYRFATIQVEDLKYVSKAVGGGATINDVYIAMAAIGLRKYMDYRIEKDASVEGNKPLPTVDASKTEPSETAAIHSAETLSKFKKLDKARVRALALINTRPAPGLPELADMMNGAASQARWGNHMGYLLLELPIKHHEDPLHIVREAMAIGNRKKSSLEGPFTYASGSLTMSLVGEKIATKLVYRSAVHTTLSMSNVKGPSQEVTFAENPITHIIPSVIGQPHALCLHLQSYNGQIFLVGMATKSVIPDPEYVLQLCVEGLQEMKKAAAKVLESK
ncbi:diacylglycerol O-acyltransferase / wax synthase [Marchantia polymorpha subsp. ruderalis]|uniref:Uncharacterized protein n=2 Tax=Marchantia polymorpha TaxID=3197 RepID=A0A176W7N3_MARPO|nr:hypothetical protein AXG93_3036s1310 [Marchantia polymorpha subsp. ruderalis]PTQ46387.1 hypothetical protein MARPO_0011s0073 [Marchantia polymorpha]PTQ46388.1 hypothetical protein MARPO_0011s0073 [Marchantia polymorpha]PTQ46389.1 hypothetical protein MARPO_0011s0073 [Marchantia polymorpha]BBN08351.1 hypothetical protein Mp_4g10870 [Marchantia polymorpha subsp. ruderalis]|eukprot:PTQ46387.1 hypothetical protein MARPO_0011s0073 [Marchantia polymorpha]